MKDVKISIAKGIFIFVVLVVAVEVAVAILFGVWVIPSVFWDVFWDELWKAIFFSFWFCCGCLLVFFITAITARQFVRSVMLAVLCSIYAVAVYQMWWIQFASSRLLLLVLLLASVCFGAILMCCKLFPKREIVQRVIVIFAILMGLPAGGAAALSIVLPAGLDTIKQTATSPNGYYQAVRIHREDTDSTDYDLITIKPTYFSVLNILDYPDTKIIEVGDGETLTGVRWANQHTLVVGYESGTSFAQQDKSWRDVKIVYKNESKTPKN